MKRFLIAATAAAALTMMMTSAGQAQTVRIATEGAYAPWNFINEAGRAAGFEIDLGNEICRRAQLTCEWVVTAWDTMIPNLLAGNFDVIMAGMSITDERLLTIDFSAEYYPSDESRFAMRAGSAINFDALSGLRIGAQTGTIHAGWLAENLAANNTILTYDTFDQAIADLAAGNLDLVLADAPYLDPIVAAAGGTLVLGGQGIQIGGGVGAGMRKEDDALQETFDRVIGAMKADGSLNALIVQWFENPNTFN